MTDKLTLALLTGMYNHCSDVNGNLVVYVFGLDTGRGLMATQPIKVICNLNCITHTHIDPNTVTVKYSKNCFVLTFFPCSLIFCIRI